MGSDRSKLTKIFLILCGICVFVSVNHGFAGAQNTAAGQDAAAEEDARWQEDISQKMDRAIKILNVIRKEVDESAKKADAAAPAELKSGQAESELGKEVKEKTSLAVRIWRKIRKVLNPEETSPSGEIEEDWTKDAEQKVDTMVKAGEKVHRMLSAYTTEAQEGTPPGEGAPWDESLKYKINKTIKVLEAVRKEIDEEEKAENKE